jgi:hypothetical protein
MDRRRQHPDSKKEPSSQASQQTWDLRKYVESKKAQQEKHETEITEARQSLGNSQEIQETNPSDDPCKDAREKHREVQAKLQRTEDKLRLTDLKPTERTNLQDYLQAMKARNENLKILSNPLLEHEVRNMRVKLEETLEKFCSRLDRSNLSSEERADYFWAQETMDKNARRLDSPYRDPTELSTTAELNKALEKFCSQLDRSDLSPDEYAKQKTSLAILKDWNKHLNNYVEKYRYSGYEERDFQILQEIYHSLENGDPIDHSRQEAEHLPMQNLKVQKNLQDTQAKLTDSNLSPNERAKLKTSLKILESWQKNLEKYANDPSENQEKKCQNLQKLYNAWEKGTISIRSQLKNPKLFWETLLTVRQNRPSNHGDSPRRNHP